MAIKKLFSKINNHRSSKTGITTTHHRDNEKCEIVPSHPSSLTDAASSPDMRNKKKKSSSTKKWRKKFSLPNGSSWTTYANSNSDPRRRNSLVAFTQSGSLPCFKAGSTTDPTTVTTSSASCADNDYNDVDELPMPQRPFSCSTVIMPDILHALRSNDKEQYEDNSNEHEEQLMTVDESSSFASRYCIASSSKFQQSSISSAVGQQHVVSPSMHAAPSCSSAPASSIDSKTAAATTDTPPDTCYQSVTHNEKIELTPPFLPSSPPPSTTDLAAIASVDPSSPSPPQDILASDTSATIAKLQVDKTMAEMRLAQSTRSLQEAMQEIKFLKNRIKYLETQDVEAEDLLRMHTRAQLGLIEYLEGEDDLAIALERFKRQLMESDEEQSQHHPQQKDNDHHPSTPEQSLPSKDDMDNPY
ncbi:hypothetical protein K492DRAFT_239025 [Lichtheimia hyalospora FSU 10163]|nr:hypothetical protein K492DRAFT_239025 [Lichtheimia hyalospora FSU 10163]